jgi:FkbH-like protein
LEDSIGQEITFGLTEFVTLRKKLEDVIPSRTTGREPGSSEAPKVKCVVWDLDNTLWKGTLAEDGVEGLTLDERVRALIVDLDRRGILQSIASKNDPKPALDALESFGIREYFLYPQIGWEPKSAAMERIAGSLDIGLDTFAFVDDQAFERGEVGERLPQIMVLSDSDIADLLEHPRLDVPITNESQQRRAMYQAEEQRKSNFDLTTGDYVEFLRGCQILVEALPITDDSLERAHELSQRTNQLNVSGRRYARNELASMQAPGSATTAYLFSCRDRFGAYGIIAMCVMKRNKPEIESFMMSCRVQRKRVEHAVFSWLLKQSREAGFDALTIAYRKTKRNEPSIRMLQELGFDFRPEHDAESGIFVLPTTAEIADDDVVSLSDQTQWSAPRAVQTA